MPQDGIWCNRMHTVTLPPSSLFSYLSLFPDSVNVQWFGMSSESPDSGEVFGAKTKDVSWPRMKLAQIDREAQIADFSHTSY